MVIKAASGIYMHAAWAKDEEGTGFSLTKFSDAQYVGNYSDKSAVESANWRKYEWQAIQEADDEEDDGAEIVEDESELDDEEEEEADGEIVSSDDVIEGLMDDIGDTAEEVQSVGADSTATQNLSDTGLGNDNLLSGTNRGLSGWTIPDGFSAEAVTGTIYDDTSEAVNYIKITCGTSGAGILQFDAGDLPDKLAHDGGSAYTLTADVAMSTCFSMPAYVGKPDGTAKQIDFGMIDNSARDLEEDSENDGVWVPAALTADALGVAADGQALCLDLSAMPAGATLEIANLKIEEGAIATPWKKSIKEVAETADTAKANAAIAQETAGSAQAGVDTLSTCIRQTDDGVEVARKNANGDYIGYKSIQTADGLEVRTADDVLVARYGSEIQLTNGIAEGFRVEFGNTLVPIKEIYPAKIEATGGETGTWAKTYTTRWAADQASGIKVSGHIYAAYASAGNLKEAAMDFDLANGKSKTIKFSDGVQAAKASVSVAYLSSGYATATISIEIGADNTVLSNVGISYTSPKSDVCMATLGTHPDTSTPAVFRIGNGTTAAPSNALLVDWSGNVAAGANMYAKSIALGGSNISSIFSGVISIGYEDKRLSIAASGNTGETTISLSKKGYSARCICGWNLSGTGSSNCTIPKLFINQANQQLHYYIKNTGSSKATPTLRAYVLYTKSDLPQLR